MDRKIAFISGATSGIGAAFARHFAQKEYDLILTGHPEDKTTLPVENLKERYDVSVKIIQADFAREEDIRKTEEIIKSNHRIEVIINNAGFVFGLPFLQNDIDNWENMISVHIHAPLRFIYAVLSKSLVSCHTSNVGYGIVGWARERSESAHHYRGIYFGGQTSLAHPAIPVISMLT